MRRIAAVGKCIAVILLTVAMSVMFIFGHDYLTQCDYFNVTRLKVEGNCRLTTAQVVHQADIQTGSNALALNLALARKRLLAHPFIADASVGRELPATIVIHIREHVPLAVLDLGRKFIVNTHGEIFKELEDADAVNLPAVTGLTFADITVGEGPLSMPLSAVLAVLRLGRENHSVIANSSIQRIHVDREIGLTLYTADRIRAVKIGYNDYRKKFQKLESLLSYLQSHKGFLQLESIDLNNLNRIVVTPDTTSAPDGDHKEV